MTFSEEHAALASRFIQRATPAQAYWLGLASAIAFQADLEPTPFYFETVLDVRNLWEALAFIDDWVETCCQLRRKQQERASTLPADSSERTQDPQRPPDGGPQSDRPANK